MKNDYVCSQIFTKEECKEIKLTLANTADKTLQDAPAEGVLKRADVSLSRYKDVKHLLYRAEQFVLDVNKNYFGYDLYPTVDNDPLFLNTYRDENQGTYSWHKDQTDDSVNFDYKLTMLLNLSDEYYGGGHLHYFTNGGERQVEEFETSGVVCVFPSYVPHYVLPVTYGTRNSMTQFYSGPRFR